MPFRSVPEEAAVAEVFGTFSVVVLVILIRLRSHWNASATTCATSPSPTCAATW